jgi:3'(2'), 5'-bisphosphate nucleotidase
VGEHEIVSMGSSLKLCLVAEGEADIYPRLGPTSEWDTAAAQAVVEAAGGMVTDTAGTPLQYNTKESLLNPEFLVFGDKSRDWTSYL